MQSRFFENATAELMELMGEYSELNLRKCLANSCMLSSDVSAGFDPSYASCFEKKNTAFLDLPSPTNTDWPANCRDIIKKPKK